MELILEKPGDGWPVDDLLRAYADLKPAHVQAAQAYCASYLAMDASIFEPAETQ